MRRQKLLVLGATAVVALGVASYAAARTERPRSTKAPSGSITIALGAEPTSLDPLQKDDGAERAVTNSIYESLLGRSTDGKTLYPRLAASMPKRLNPTTWQFKLRSGITFDDGERFNADAVVFSVKRIIDPKYASEQIAFVGSIKTAVKVNDLTVNIVTSGPDPILPSRMSWLRIVPPLAAQKPGFASLPVGTGPYKIVEWARGNQITLEAKTNYWGNPKPSIQTIRYRFVPEEGAQLAGLISGDYDLVTTLLPEQVARAPKSAKTPGLEHPFVVLNARSNTTAITRDVRVRQALNYAVDKNAIIKALFDGAATLDGAQLLSPTWFGYDPRVKAYPYDPEKARALLKAAGAVGKSITLVGENGRWLKDKETIDAIAQYWREVGLKVNEEILDFNTYVTTLFNQKVRPDAIYVSHSNELYDADRTFSTYYASNGVGASASDKVMDAWIVKARTEINVRKRLALYHKVIARSSRQANLLWLFNNENLWGMSKRLVWQPRQDAFIYANTMSLAK